VQEVKTWSGHRFPFLFFREVAMLLWLMMGHYGTDNVVSDGQREVPVSVLLSVHPLDERLAVHSHPACLQQNKNSNFGVWNPTVFSNVKPKAIFTQSTQIVRVNKFLCVAIVEFFF
jgi:hypothetical protein